MRSTALKIGKLRWLLKSSGFRRDPWGVVLRVFLWEIYRLLNIEISYFYDQQFPVTLRPNEGVSRLVYYFGVSEPDLFDFYNTYLRPGMTVMDVGANIGLHSLYMAKRVLPAGRIYSFEPSKKIFARLCRHVESSNLSNISCYPCALGPQSGEAFFHEVESDSSRSFLCDSPSGERVVVRTLDDIAAENRLNKIDFVKLDVEGFELGVLQGSQQLLEHGRIDVFQVEVDCNSLARNAADAEGIFSFLTYRKYIHAVWDSNRRFFRTAERASEMEYNSFFVHPTLMPKTINP